MKLNGPALVTGATGFVGRNLVKKLHELDHEVIALIRPGSDASWLNSNDVPVMVYEGNTLSLRSKIERARPSIIFHLASNVVVEHRPDQIIDLVESNITFGIQLADAAVAAGCKKFINTGTSWQHYHSDEYNPVSLYSATKQAYEDILKYYSDAHGLKVCTLKLFDTYGPGDQRRKLLNLIHGAIISGENLGMSPGEQKINLVHINDVVEAFLVAADRMENLELPSFEQYAVRSHFNISLKELIAVVSEIIGSPAPIKFGERAYRFREVMIPWNGATLPGWHPVVELRDGLAELFERKGV